ncbi:PAP2 superfamily-domain-containing protein [Peziza echinospora]|nr:PAP2 superfamily-domain-containing protein [Peziza echinospora]
MEKNSTGSGLDTPAQDAPKWNTAWTMPGWFEPVVITFILLFACYYTRRRSASILGAQSKKYRPILGDSNSPQDDQWDESYSDDDLADGQSNDSQGSSSFFISSTSPETKKRRTCFSRTIMTPNTSRFANNFFSRVLNKLPFLIEIFYWVITYAAYQFSRGLGQKYFGDIWAVAEAHGLQVLNFEHNGYLNWFFWLEEAQVQNWFLMEENAGYLTFLNRFYALVHIPGTVAFIAWYYAVAPNHDIFAVVRRTMTLCNWMAFAIFAFYPCMPPRLLPEEYGFIDTVRRANAESLWMSGKYVNSLAAMPSMHFGYAFIIGMTFIYHSGMLRCVHFSYPDYILDAQAKADAATGKTTWRKFKSIMLCVIGVWYPSMILTVIVATANHYWMDALVAAIVAVCALFANKLFLVCLPIEDWFLWCLRVDKPKPTCGKRRQW